MQISEQEHVRKPFRTGTCTTGVPLSLCVTVVYLPQPNGYLNHLCGSPPISRYLNFPWPESVIFIILSHLDMFQFVFLILHKFRRSRQKDPGLKKIREKRFLVQLKCPNSRGETVDCKAVRVTGTLFRSLYLAENRIVVYKIGSASKPGKSCQVHFPTLKIYYFAKF